MRTRLRARGAPVLLALAALTLAVAIPSLYLERNAALLVTQVLEAQAPEVAERIPRGVETTLLSLSDGPAGEAFTDVAQAGAAAERNGGAGERPDP